MWHFINDNCENSHCSQEQVEEYLAGNCSDGNVSVLLKLIPMPEKSYSQDKPMDVSTDSQFGMTLERLTEDRGEAESILSLEDSHAKTSQQQETELGLLEKNLDCGPRWRELSVKYDQATCSWKTHRCLFEEDLDWSCLTLPHWGMMRDGELLERITPALLIKEIEFGLWPTPNARDYKGMPGAGCRERGGRQWSLPVAIGGKPNPKWIEWLMGWPIKWTEHDVSVTDKYQEWLNSHGKY